MEGRGRTDLTRATRLSERTRREESQRQPPSQPLSPTIDFDSQPNPNVGTHPRGSPSAHLHISLLMSPAHRAPNLPSAPSPHAKDRSGSVRSSDPRPCPSASDPTKRSSSGQNGRRRRRTQPPPRPQQHRKTQHPQAASSPCPGPTATRSAPCKRQTGHPRRHGSRQRRRRGPPRRGTPTIWRCAASPSPPSRGTRMRSPSTLGARGGRIPRRLRRFTSRWRPRTLTFLLSWRAAPGRMSLRRPWGCMMRMRRETSLGRRGLLIRCSITMGCLMCCARLILAF